MPRYRIDLSYRGSAFHGWQIQPNAISVQEELNTKISQLAGEEVNVVGAGRTDTGVHARNFVAHFDTQNPILKMPLKDFAFKLNTFVCKDIVIHDLQEVGEEFHARFGAEWRMYKYYIHQQKDPFLQGLSWYKYGTLDVEAMNRAANLLIGKKDFSSFSKSHTQVKTNICDLQEAYWEVREHQLIFTIKADRFLRNMVRAVVGTLVEVGRGKIAPEEVLRIVERKDRSEAGTSVPAEGLYLWKIYYGEE